MNPINKVKRDIEKQIRARPEVDYLGSWVANELEVRVKPEYAFSESRHGAKVFVKFEMNDDYSRYRLKTQFGLDDLNGKVFNMNKTPRKVNPIKRKGISARAYVNRPSQIAKAAPSKRLKARRKLAQSGPEGYFPNPRKTLKKNPVAKYLVQQAQDPGNHKVEDSEWLTVGWASNEKIARVMAAAVARDNPSFQVRVYEK